MCALFLKATCTSNVTDGIAVCVCVCVCARVHVCARSHIVSDGFPAVMSRAVVPLKIASLTACTQAETCKHTHSLTHTID